MIEYLRETLTESPRSNRPNSTQFDDSPYTIPSSIGFWQPQAHRKIVARRLQARQGDQEIKWSVTPSKSIPMAT